MWIRCRGWRAWRSGYQATAARLALALRRRRGTGGREGDDGAGHRGRRGAWAAFVAENDVADHGADRGLELHVGRLSRRLHSSGVGRRARRLLRREPAEHLALGLFVDYGFLRVVAHRDDD